MTPKEKAFELVGKYVFLTVTDFSDENFEQTKQCALIAIDEILDNNLWFKDEVNNNYWQEVKIEIEKL